MLGTDLRRFSAALVACIALTTAAVAQPAPADGKWHESELPKEGFAAAFPVTPRLDTAGQHTDVGALRIRMFSSASSDGYFAVVAIIPPVAVERDSARLERLLESAEQKSIGNVKGTVTSRKQITRFGLRGREVVASLPDGGELHAQFFATNERIFSALAILGPGMRDTASVTRFFNSFRLI